MLYGKIVDGVLIYAPPEVYKENGEVIILKTPSDYYDNGYKFVRRNTPKYDPMKEILVLDNIIENDNEISITYKLMDPYDSIINEEVNM